MALSLFSSIPHSSIPPASNPPSLTSLSLCSSIPLFLHPSAPQSLCPSILPASIPLFLHPSLPTPSILCSSIPPVAPSFFPFPWQRPSRAEICPLSPSYLSPLSFISLLISLSILNLCPLLPFSLSPFSSPPMPSLSQGYNYLNLTLKK